VIDASDRHREAASADYSPANLETATAGEGGGLSWSPGVDVLTETTLTDGAEYMALATGGTMFAGSRNVGRVMDGLRSHVSNYYYIGYRRPGPPDGKRHRVDVEVAGEKRLRVRHHEKVLDRTVPQRLGDIALSRLRLDVGLNPLDLEISLGETEPAEKDRVIQSIEITVPLAKLLLLPQEGNYAGQILVAVAVLDDEGRTAPPQLLRLRLAVPVAEVQDDTLASQTIRLLMKHGTRKIAVSVRDEVSGVEGSNSVAIPALDI
jgi:hypothetical protein